MLIYYLHCILHHGHLDLINFAFAYHDVRNDMLDEASMKSESHRADDPSAFGSPRVVIVLPRHLSSNGTRLRYFYTAYTLAAHSDSSTGFPSHTTTTSSSESTSEFNYGDILRRIRLPVLDEAAGSI